MNTERITPLVAFRVEKVCECGGDMVFGGVVLTSNPPQYPHRCGKCGAAATFGSSYPRIEHREAPWNTW